MLDRKTYKLMKKKYGGVGSWAVWCPQTDKNAPKSNMGNMDWTKNEDGLCSVLNPEFVFVGLNLSDSHGKYSDANTPWVNFHSGNPHGNSFKLRFALKDTQFWGAYMTDLIKGVKVIMVCTVRPVACNSRSPRMDAKQPRLNTQQMRV